jgi:hypothetical protein
MHPSTKQKRKLRSKTFHFRNFFYRWPKNIRECPLGLDVHPMNGEADYSLGCAMCRQTAEARF